MANEWTALSNELAAVVAQTEGAVVAVHARPRFSSSGVFWRPGVVVTAEHTLRREEDITVTLPTGATVAASLAGSDPGTDLAVLKVDGDGGRVLSTASAAPLPGQLILALGRSKNSGVNATMGIVSAVSGAWRTWRGGRLDHYIRLDTTFFPESSGGAVINTAGEVIGIATSALSRIAGLAIPASTVNRVVDDILTRGQVSHGYLGMGLQPVELPGHQKGLIALSVAADGPAAKAGALIGDILISLGGSAAHDTEEIQGVLETHAVGAAVEAIVWRGGVEQKLVITIGERPRRN
jgi:S1-C subfamily serine protease